MPDYFSLVLSLTLTVTGHCLEVHPRVGLIRVRVRVRVRVRPAGELLRQRPVTVLKNNHTINCTKY